MSRAVAEQLRRLFVSGTVAGMEEGALLDRFLARHDSAAFEALVARHGPMVLGICRRFLRDPHDVDDAFQATFLILVRKASSLRRRDALAPWLHGVAYRVAIRARAQAATRPDAMEQLDPADVRDDSAHAAIEQAEAAQALHEELARLPEAYRAPVVLCYLEGLTHDEAAQRLHWPVGTVRGRLARARDKLRDRLARRGLGPAACTLGTVPTRPPAVPFPLLNTATRGALRLAEAGSLHALPGSGAISLAQGVLGMMAWNHLKMAAAMAMLLGTVGTGVVWSAGQGSGREREGSREVRPAAAQKAIGERSPAEVVKKARTPLLNLPEGALPFLGEEDTTGKIRAACETYDKEVAKLADQTTDQEADAEIRAAEVDATKKLLAKVTEELLEYRLEGKDGGEVQDAVKQKTQQLTRCVEDLKQSLILTMRESAVARSRLENTRHRLSDLKRRPRPTERIEVQPGDKLIVEVLEALPGRPISGERYVRADGRISLGFYGEIYVAGLSLPEIKEKMILRLRKILPDETLGLIEVVDESGKTRTIKPRESSRVFVDIVEDSPPEGRE